MKTNKRDAWINRLSYAWLLLFAGVGVWVLLHRSEASVARPGAAIDQSHSNTAHESAASVETSRSVGKGAAGVRIGHRNIEDIRVGQRVFARNPEISDDERAAWEEPDWSQWRLAKLEMAKPDGGVLKIEMIRPREWFALEAAEPGAEFWLDLPEMGAEGPARVVSISECPPIRFGPGQVVTATFAHPPSTAVLDVRFEGEPQPIGVTDNHLFWSVEREEFLPIGQMSEGDHVLTYSGETKRIESKLPRPGPALVYNLEVYGEHVYFVGDEGLLVHNNYGEIALGKGRGLAEFADHVGASPWQRWRMDEITRRDPFGRHFGRVFNDASQHATRIHFNLDGIPDPIAAALKGRAGFAAENFTNAELNLIRNSKGLLEKTTFYRNGVPVPPPF